MRRVKRSRQPKPDILTAAWIDGAPPPADAAEDKDRLIGLIYFGEHPPKRWQGLHHPRQRAWLDALAEKPAKQPGRRALPGC